MRRTRRSLGQTGTEYMLAISVVVIAIFASFYVVVGDRGSGPAERSFKNVRQTIERPWP